ncbi:hypothetical protein PSHT_13517 [Puccinia striiformis]|uniref:Uncharacterized protein n=1 Tax=Puccinia striiformis TaxID=27350 RepID=A0A2S4UR45_9BASI|nr:hypothetical protein PSHT_13517 [Puccinia striiformis]
MVKPTNSTDSLDIQQATSYSEQCILYGLSEAYQQSDPSDMSPHTPWSYVLEVASHLPAAYHNPITAAEFVRFASPFLSEQYLVCLQELLDHLTFSDAGLDFTLRNHNLGILERILADLQELNDDAEDDRRYQDNDKNPLQHSGSGDPSIFDTYHKITHSFKEATIIDLQMSSSKTPPKHSRERNRTISDRSTAFSKHPAIIEITADSSLYNPDQQTEGIARIFHGTRHSSLKSYYEYGIHPAYTRNEFSFSPAFYASNDPQQGFEYPLHQHLGIVSASTIDPVALMQFDVPISVLHGLTSPGEGQEPFKVYRFPKITSPTQLTNWQEFCDFNMKASHSLGHPHDLVIGPICLPSKNDQPVRCLQMKNSSIITTHIAFCSPRSMAWLGHHIRRIYIESRDHSNSPFVPIQPTL